MLETQLKDAIENNVLSLDLADRYLNIYISDIDWKPHLLDLWGVAQKKSSSEQEAKKYMRNAIACAMLLPLVEKTQIPDPPSNLIFWCTAWKQFESRDWFEELKKVFLEDIKISDVRNNLIELGVFTRVDALPITRQAFNWIYEKVIEEKSLNKNSIDSTKNKINNLVRVYGGAAVCSVFVKHSSNVDNVLNWRSGYFFEKELHKIYDSDKLKKIKRAEIEKTNSKYIKILNKSGS